MSKVTVYVGPQSKPISDRVGLAVGVIITSSIMGGTLTALFLIPGFAPFLAGAFFGLAISKS